MTLKDSKAAMDKKKEAKVRSSSKEKTVKNELKSPSKKSKTANNEENKDKRSHSKSKGEKEKSSKSKTKSEEKTLRSKDPSPVKKSTKKTEHIKQSEKSPKPKHKPEKSPKLVKKSENIIAPEKSPKLRTKSNINSKSKSKIIQEPKSPEILTPKNVEEQLEIHPPRGGQQNGAISSEEDQYDDYEDDFDSYDDDFEDYDEESDKESHKSSSRLKTGALKSKRIADDNASMMPEKGSDSENSESLKHSGKKSADEGRKSVQSRIDFNNATVRQAHYPGPALGKRSKVLLNLLTLDTVSYDMFEMAPIKDYEFYMENFGNSNRIQKHTQTSEDSIGREIQTNGIETNDKWTQMPATDNKGYGGDSIGTVQEQEDDGSNSLLELTHYYASVKFKRFISRTGQLFMELLNESDVTESFKCHEKLQSKLTVGYSELTLGPLAKGCTCVTVCFDNQNTACAALFYITQSPLEELAFKSVIGIWQLNNLFVPKRVLIATGMGRTMCYSPNKSAIFVGMDDGSVVAWNFKGSTLQGDDDLVLPWGEQDEVELQYPSYSTAHIFSNANHKDSVVQIMPLVSPAQDISQDDDTCQLACLSANGNVQIWTVLNNQQDTGDVFDFGQTPGSSMKLVLSSVINMGPKLSSQSQSFCMASCVSEGSSGHLLVGTDTGYIRHCIRQSNTSTTSLKPNLEAVSDVFCVSVSPFEPSIILASSSDGCIRMYHLPNVKQVQEFRLQNSDEIVSQVQWSLQSPYMFYSVHGGTTLVGWDLKHHGTTEKRGSVEKITGGSKITDMSLAVDSEDVAYLGLSLEDGAARVYLLLKATGKYSYTEDGQKLVKMIEKL